MGIKRSTSAVTNKSRNSLPLHVNSERPTRSPTLLYVNRFSPQMWRAFSSAAETTNTTNELQRLRPTRRPSKKAN